MCYKCLSPIKLGVASVHGLCLHYLCIFSAAHVGDEYMKDKCQTLTILPDYLSVYLYLSAYLCLSVYLFNSLSILF